MTDFMPKEPQEVVDELKKVLYDRLYDVQRNAACKIDPEDLFDQGIDCRLANEEVWLTDLLDKIERS